MQPEVTQIMKPRVERTDAEAVSMAPLKVKFGEKDYDVAVLKITPARKWRDALVTEATEIINEMRKEADTKAAFVHGLGFMFLKFPEKLADLVFSYAPDLPKDQILEEATEEQLARAFGQIMQVAFPFVGELQMVTKVLSTI